MPENPAAQFFEEVAAENAKQAIEQPGDLRSAVNAIMTLDGFFGTLHSQFLRAGLISDRSDDRWKEMLARDCPHYRVLRDTAYALKHGELTRPNPPRLVRRSDQIVTMPGAFQANAFQNNAFQVQRVWIEGEDTDYPASEVIETVLGLAHDWVNRLPA